MATSKNNDVYSYLDQFSTQELEALLQKDAEDPDGGDLDMVMYIMEVIEKREGGGSEAEKKAAAQALEEFFDIYATPEGDGLQLYPCDIPDCATPDPVGFTRNTKHPKFSIRKALLFAAVLICLLSLIICTALGFERVFQMVGKWTSEIFTFENAYQGDMPEKEGTEITAPTDNMKYASMEDALTAYGITEKVVPTRFPEDFAVVTVDVSKSEHGGFVNFCAVYQSEDHYLILQIRQISDVNAENFEKDDGAVTEYAKDGIRHYFYTNVNSNCVTWFNGNLECVIDTDLPAEILQDAVESIYER